MFKEILGHTLMITSFVLVMMLIIEYINIQSKGNWGKHLKKNPILQLFVAAILGILPGCLGTFTVVSLYTHNIINFAAVVTAMIATSGDEAFVMFSAIPETAIIITGSIFFIAIITGLIVHFFGKKRQENFSEKDFPFHGEKYCVSLNRKEITYNLKKLSFQRGLLLTTILIFITYILISVTTANFHTKHNHTQAAQVHTEQCTHDHAHSDKQEIKATAHNHSHSFEKWDWLTITFLTCSFLALFIIITVPEHFLQEHLWEHIFKKHLLRIFLWIFGALILIHFLTEQLDISVWLKENTWIILVVAVLIGIIPTSGPHLIFITMFAQGLIPFSILLASSIVQDGHGSLPLFAEAKKSFIKVKIINIFVGLLVGAALIFLGF